MAFRRAESDSAHATAGVGAEFRQLDDALLQSIRIRGRQFGFAGQRRY